MIVKKLRLQRGWSQEQLAELAGLSIRTIQRVERGQKPSLETVRSLAAVFEVDLSKFKPGEEVMKAKDQNSTNQDIDPNLSISEDEREAINYVKSIKEFFTHLLFFVVFTLVIIVKKDINDLHIFWPLIIWCLGVIFHGLMAFSVINVDRLRLFSANWEKKIIEKRIGRKL